MPQSSYWENKAHIQLPHGVSLTELCFLHEELCEGPADPTDKGGQQDHDETLQVKLSGFKRKHK